MMVQWLRSLDAKLEAHGSNPSQGIEKEKKVCHHTTMWWCDGTLAFSLQKCDFPPNVSSLVPRPPRPMAKRWSGIMLQDSWIKRK